MGDGGVGAGDRRREAGGRTTVGGARVGFAAIPVVPVALGVKRVEDGNATLDRAASAVGWVVILAGEACVAAAVFQVSALADLIPVARFVLYGAGAAALWVHALEGRSAGKARFAGYIGIAAGFAIYRFDARRKRRLRQRLWRVFRGICSQVAAPGS